jgi:hypothetical protein
VIDVSVLVVAKASDTHPSTCFTTTLVFSSSMHDRLIFKRVYKCLEPSSV